MGTEEAPPRPNATIGEMFRKIIDHIPVMLVCYDGAANPILLNREFTRVLGWTLEEARKVDLMVECYPDPAYRKEARAYMASAQPGWNDFRVRARDGRIVETSWANVHLSDGSHIAIGIDATERNRAEQEKLVEPLTRAKVEFEQFFGLVPDLMCIASLDGYFRKLNPAWETTLGYAVDELTGSPYLNFVHPEDVRSTEEEAKKIVVGTHGGNFVNRYRCKDGSWRWLQWNARSPSESGMFFAVARDITEQRRVIAALEGSEERYRSLFESSRAAMLLIDPESGRIVDANTAACGYYGFPCDRLRSMTIMDINTLPPEEVFRDMRKARTRECGRFTFTHRLASGEVRPVEVFSGPIRDHDRDLLFSIVHDIADRVRAEEALRDSEERFRSLAERIPQPVFETDEGGRLTYMNLHGRNLFGYPEEELVGNMSIFDLIDPTDREKGRETFRMRIEEGFDGPREYIWTRKDGTRFPAIAYAAPIRREGGPAGIGGVLMDLTDLRKAESELMIAQKYEAVGRLAGGIAHHLNNLMTVVAGYGALIIDRMGVHDPWRREVEEMRRAGERAAKLTGQLLAYSRRQILRPERIEPGRFLAEIGEELRGAAGPDVAVSIRQDPGDFSILVDRELLRNALRCLVENSGRAMPTGGTVVILSRKADVTGEGGLPVPTGKYGMISVTDTGVGMDAETRAHVFEPFFTTRPVGDGAGMSLPSVYGFVKQSKGYIFVESAPGKGTTVSIYLPLAEP